MGAKSGGEKLRKSEWPARILCSTGNSPLHFLSTHTFASSSIDRVLSESLDEDEKKTWIEGLKLIEVMSERSCGKSILEASPEQRTAVLQVLSDNLEMTEVLEVRFFRQLKRLTVDAYYTSKIGILEELEYKGNTVLEEFVGCKDLQT